MTKESLLMWLREAFSAYPPEEVEERLRFYEELIDDRMEEGMTEEEAVASLGSLEEVIAKMGTEIPPLKKRKAKWHLRWWEILLIVLCFPLWLPLLIAALAVGLAIYISVWSVIASFWAVFLSVVVCSFFAILIGIGGSLFGNRMKGIALLGAGIFCFGLSILLFWGCKAATNGVLFLTKKLLRAIKNCFVRKECAE
jgi:uncharacterized membrane protein